MINKCYGSHQFIGLIKKKNEVFFLWNTDPICNLKIMQIFA